LEGLLLPAERNKTLTTLANTEPVSGAQRKEAQSLQWFLSESRWDPEKVNERRLEVLHEESTTAPDEKGAASTCRTERFGSTLRPTQGSPADAKSWTARMHTLQKEADHPPRCLGHARTGPREQKRRRHFTRPFVDGGHHLFENRRRLPLPGVRARVYSRKVVGWSMASHLRTELVVDALEMAVWRRKPTAGLVHHSDRGTQYTALPFGKKLEEAGIVPSMGRAQVGAGQRHL
jgi:transposase InsO family protein